MISLSISIANGTPNSGDIGVVLTATLTQSSAAYDLTNATSGLITLNFVDPANNMFTRAGIVSSTPTSGIVTYSFASGDLPISGKYSLQAVIGLTTGDQYTSNVATFTVGQLLTGNGITHCVSGKYKTSKGYIFNLINKKGA